MNGRQHFAEAERLLAKTDHLPVAATRRLVAAAQVHAVLAVADALLPVTRTERYVTVPLPMDALDGAS